MRLVGSGEAVAGSLIHLPTCERTDRVRHALRGVSSTISSTDLMDGLLDECVLVFRVSASGPTVGALPT